MKFNSIVFKDDEKRQITAPVMIPYYDDCDACIGEKQFTPEEIGVFENLYSQKYGLGDTGHSINPNETLDTSKITHVPVKSWQLDETKSFKTLEGGEVFYPKGTWMLTSEVTDDATWEGVQKGVFKGYSATAVRKEIADRLVASKERTLIKDIPNAAIPVVAIVESPCVQASQFCSIKSTNTSDSFEERRDKLRKALRDTYPNDEAYIKYTFPDKMIVSVWNPDDGNKLFELPYSIDVEGKVQLGEHKEVTVQYVAKMKETATKRSFFNKIVDPLKNVLNNSEAEKMAQEDKKDEYVKKSDLDKALKENNAEIIKEITKSLKEDKSENSSSEKDNEESEEDKDTVSKKEYDKLAEKNKEYKKKLGIEVESQSLKDKNNNEDKTATKSEQEIVLENMGRTPKGEPKK